MIGARIGSARRKAGLTQQELGDMLSVTSETISRYEAGVMSPKDDRKVAIAKILNVSLDYLMGATNLEIPLIREDAVDLPKGFRKDSIPSVKEYINTVYRADKAE